MPSNTTSNATSSLTHEYSTILLFRLFSYAGFYLVGPLLPFAFTTNCMLLYIFLRAPISTRKTTRIYYVVVACGELGTIFFKYLWWMFLGIGASTVFAPQDPIKSMNPSELHTSMWICPIVFLNWYSLEMIANNMFVIFQMERVTALYFPMQVSSIFSPKRSVLIAAGLVLISYSLVATLFGFARAQPIDKNLMPLGSICLFAEQKDALLWSVCEVLIFVGVYILPSVASLICSMLTTMKIVRRAYAKWRLEALHANIQEHHVAAAAGLSRKELSVCNA